MQVIDTHIHIIVPEITRAVTGDAWSPDVRWTDGRQSVDFDGKIIDSALREFVEIETILDEQGESGVDCVLLSPWSSLFAYDLELPRAQQVSRIQNEALASLAQRHSDRVRALGTVPLQDVGAAVDELRYCVQSLGLRGVEIGTNVNGVYLGDDRFRPFWAEAQALGALVQVHPVSGIGGPTNREYYLWNAFANPAETALTAAHIILCGLFEDLPDLKISLVHGGGHLPYQIGRLDRAHKMRPEVRRRISRPPSSYLPMFYFDTVVHSPTALRYLLDVVGRHRIMLGSDYPFDMGSEKPSEIVEALGLPDEQRGQLLGDNASAALWDA